METTAISRKSVTAPVRTETQAARDERNRRMWDEYTRLLAEAPDRSRTAMKDALKRKYNIVSDSGYYAIISRMSGEVGHAPGKGER